MQNYPRISEEKYKKLVFQARGQFVAILNVFNCYGQNHDVDQAIEECMQILENFSMAVRGKNAPIHILSKPKRRPTD